MKLIFKLFTVALMASTGAQAAVSLRANFSNSQYVVLENLTNGVFPGVEFSTNVYGGNGGPYVSTFENAYNLALNSGVIDNNPADFVLNPPMVSVFRFVPDSYVNVNEFFGMVRIDLDVYKSASIANTIYSPNWQFTYLNEFYLYYAFPINRMDGSRNYTKVGNNYIFNIPDIKNYYNTPGSLDNALFYAMDDRASFVLEAQNSDGGYYSMGYGPFYYSPDSIVIGDLVGIPEPSVWFSWLVGLTILGVFMRRKRANKSVLAEWNSRTKFARALD